MQTTPAAIKARPAPLILIVLPLALSYQGTPVDYFKSQMSIQSQSGKTQAA